MFLGQDLCHVIEAPDLPALPLCPMQPHWPEPPPEGDALPTEQRTIKAESLGYGGINPDRGLAVS